MKICDRWLQDLPQQFLGKQKIEVLVRVLARQLQEVQDVYGSLAGQTDLGTACGKNLDYAGSIVALSRKGSHAILRKVDSYEITDDIYRKVLLFQTIRNNCDCTYEDVMGSMRLLWDMENIRYKEDPKRPATIYIHVPGVSIDSPDQTINRILAVKPAGVAVIYSVIYEFVFQISGMEKVWVERVIIGICIPFWNTKPVDTAGVPFARNSHIVFAAAMEAVSENVEGSITIRKDLWHLDGEFLLDGTKLLDAELLEEVL